MTFAVVWSFVSGLFKPVGAIFAGVGAFLKPFAPHLVVAALAVLACVASYRMGRGSALRGAEVAALKFERDAAKRDLAIFKRSSEDAQAFRLEETKIEARRQGATDAIAEFEKTRPKVERDCRLPSPDDWRRLQQIR